MSANPLPRLRKPEDIAEALGCSAWWVREKARRREIPFVKVGGAYRFTDDHLTEIIALFEQRPGEPSSSRASTPRRRAQTPPSEVVVRLQARAPRRRRTG